MSTVEYVVVDVEGTLTAGSMWRGIGRYLGATGRAGAYRRFVAWTLPGILAMRLGLIDRQAYKNRWLELEAGLLAGATPEDIERLAEWVVEEELWPLRRPAVVAELAAHRARGRTVVLASGMYEAVLASLARRLDSQDEPAHSGASAGTSPGIKYVGTPLAFTDGRFAGRFAGPVCVGQEKARRVLQHLGIDGAAQAPGHIVAAYGDTAADVPLLELARDPVAVAPDRTLARAAAAQGWRVIRG